MNNDLISRSALLEEATRSFDAFIHGAYFRAACDAIRAKKAVARMLNDAPSVDAEAVRHGRWLPTNDENKKRCSRCDVIHLIAQYPHGQANYCPNCGAKMDGDADGFV